MNGLETFDARLNALIVNLSPTTRREMARTIAKRLRATQQQNIKRQQAPDGTSFKPRKAPARKKKGWIKREMFAKLRTAKYMKAKGTADDAVVEFTGNVQRMARVHHYGLRDRPARGGKEVRYEVRPLFGLLEKDLVIIDEIILQNFKE
ncbi:phage virion morphogenesis protein [Erwinia sp. BC051422]|uniref:phage virion morphogenesis protein n=1 Tax=Erwinia wuhanensis TaxID=3045167 RepID=UPI0026527F54|nr:phage virion morphogenesis protein [Erwinia sp. BC051422]MDN8542022.1 phage virion morphogenesis protein [Erwinia sp. BC051422]